MTFQNQKDTTLEHTKSYISAKGLTTDLPLENNQIYDFQRLFSEAFSKLNAIAETKQLMTEAGCLESQNPITMMLKFVEGYESPFLSTQEFQASNVEKLALDYFFDFQTGSFFQRHFLFGTPSQKRTWTSHIMGGGDRYVQMSKSLTDYPLRHLISLFEYNIPQLFLSFSSEFQPLFATFGLF